MKITKIDYEIEVKGRKVSGSFDCPAVDITARDSVVYKKTMELIQIQFDRLIRSAICTETGGHKFDVIGMCKKCNAVEAGK